MVTSFLRWAKGENASSPTDRRLDLGDLGVGEEGPAIRAMACGEEFPFGEACSLNFTRDEVRHA
jgi:hypothetical protein